MKNNFTSLITWLGSTKEHQDKLSDCIKYDNQKTKRLEVPDPRRLFIQKPLHR
ncbi:MAG: hypothetical protein HQ538_04180 [Parcubacteria group bacterium]|nr:hypothetical protein [Parcubacteria group bacterium]